MSVFGDYKKEIMDAAHNERISLALSRAIYSYRVNTNKALERFPYVREMAKEVREIKAKAIGEMEKLAEQACESIEQNKGKAYIAKTAEDALDIIEKLAGKDKLIVKAKSMTCDEIGVRERLEEVGNEVYETDLGEFILQKLDAKPMHILSPAIHIPKEDVAELFSKITGEQLPPDDIQKLVETARVLLREKYFEADIGISGANIVAADTGTLVLIENEGNIRLATGAPPVHIALVSMEKLVPTVSDAFKVAQVTWTYASYPVPSYVNFISGPSKTGDIEKIPVYGAHGPKEFHVIFMDAGRTELAKYPILNQALFCLGCGGCLYECPVYAMTAGHFGDKRFGGAGAIWAAMITQDIEKAASLAYTCLNCGRCKVRCPMEIDTPSMCVELRRMIIEGDGHLMSDLPL